MPRARYGPALSEDETAQLGAMDDEHKLTVAHAIRLAIIDVRTKDLALLFELLNAWDTDQFERMAGLFELARDVISAFEQFRLPAPGAEGRSL